MPLTIPPFNQYQSPIVPLRGLWNSAPPEGDKFITAEIDWLVTTTQQAVQFAVSANSPVSFSQIVALAVDNSRSGADVDFVFSDSGFVLTVPAHNQLVAPVFTNGLMFYVVANGAVASDITTFQVLNSMPPPVAWQPTVEQNHANVAGIGLAAGTTAIVPAGVNGTLDTFSISVEVNEGAAAGVAQLQLNDGAAHALWSGTINAAANAVQTFPFNISGLSLRFFNGINFVIAGSTLTGGLAIVNVYYSTP